MGHAICPGGYLDRYKFECVGIMDACMAVRRSTR